MTATLPNLELLHYKSKQCLGTNRELNCFVFRQAWPNTATAFDGWGGCAITNAYTTVFLDTSTSRAVVFVNNEYCYCVGSTDAFLEDLNNKSIVSVREALKKYEVLDD